jgi:hypothetical protein
VSSTVVKGIIGAFCAALWASASQADPLQLVARSLNEGLNTVVDCGVDGETRVGVFPFEEARLPIAPENAFALYENLLGALIQDAPECVRYVDGRGAMVTLGYLSQTGTLRETGQAHRAEIQQRLATVDYVLDGTMVDQAGTLTAVFRLTDFGSGAAVGRAELLVPERYQSTICGAGALPIEVATRRIASALVDRAADLRHVIVVGGYFGDGDVQTGFSRLLERELLAQMSVSAENSITGAVLRVDYLRQQDATRLRSLRGVSVSPREFEVEGTAVTQAPDSACGRLQAPVPLLALRGRCGGPSERNSAQPRGARHHRTGQYQPRGVAFWHRPASRAPARARGLGPRRSLHLPNDQPARSQPDLPCGRETGGAISDGS